jgi:hypothetical protein
VQQQWWWWRGELQLQRQQQPRHHWNSGRTGTSNAHPSRPYNTVTMLAGACLLHKSPIPQLPHPFTHLVWQEGQGHPL